MEDEELSGYDDLRFSVFTLAVVSLMTGTAVGGLVERAGPGFEMPLWAHVAWTVAGVVILVVVGRMAWIVLTSAYSEELEPLKDTEMRT